MNLNENNKILLTEALSDLLVFIQESVPHLSHVSANDINENTVAIASAKIKLERISKEKAQEFSAQEMKVMYWAAKHFRDDTQEFIDSLSPSAPERNDAIFAYKTANALLRELRADFSQIGIDIEAALPFL